MFATLLFLNIIICHICPSVLHEIWIPVTGHVTQSQLVTLSGCLLFQVHLNIFLQFFISFISKTSYLSFSSHMYKSNKICCQFNNPVILYCTFVSSLWSSSCFSARPLPVSFCRYLCLQNCMFLICGYWLHHPAKCSLFVVSQVFIFSHSASLSPQPVKADGYPPCGWFCWGLLPVKRIFSSPLFPSACSKGNNRISPIILSRTVLLTFVGKLHWNDLWLWLVVVHSKK